MANLSLSLAPANLGQIGPIMVTNAMFTAIVCTLTIIVFGFWMGKKATVVPGRAQVLFEMMVEMMLDKMKIAFGSEKKARKYFPYFFTIFFFLVLANNFTFIPFVEAIVTGEGTKIFTAPSSHYSLTIALALMILVFTHVVAFTISPIKHIGNFIKIGGIFKARSINDLMMALVDFILGLLDLVGEVAKLISLSTRLFGNIFAGGVIITIIGSLSFYTQFFIGIPFLLLSLISGFIQAFVISFLGVLFASGMIGSVSPQEQGA